MTSLMGGISREFTLIKKYLMRRDFQDTGRSFRKFGLKDSFCLLLAKFAELRAKFGA
jgi:hypothetical protein